MTARGRKMNHCIEATLLKLSKQRLYLPCINVNYLPDFFRKIPGDEFMGLKYENSIYRGIQNMV